MNTPDYDETCLNGSDTENVLCKLPPTPIEGPTALTRPVPLSLQLAWKNHEAGQLAEAEALYKTILASDPDHIDTLRSLGVLAHSSKRYDEAIDLLGKVIGLDPTNAQAHVNLADVYRAQGELDAAAKSTRAEP
jgi:tetratricopeptide (TPR) repeat protein